MAKKESRRARQSNWGRSYRCACACSNANAEFETLTCMHVNPVYVACMHVRGCFMMILILSFMNCSGRLPASLPRSVFSRHRCVYACNCSRLSRVQGRNLVIGRMTINEHMDMLFMGSAPPWSILMLDQDVCASIGHLFCSAAIRSRNAMVFWDWVSPPATATGPLAME